MCLNWGILGSDRNFNLKHLTCTKFDFGNDTQKFKKNFIEEKKKKRKMNLQKSKESKI